MIGRSEIDIAFICGYAYVEGKDKFGRELKEKDALGFDFSTDFQVESYLEYQGNKFVERFDANSYLYITKAMDYYDLPGKYGSLTAAFENAEARFLILSFTSDWLFPPYQSREIAGALRSLAKDVSYCEIGSLYGHDAFLLENERIATLIADHLAATLGERS